MFISLDEPKGRYMFFITFIPQAFMVLTILDVCNNVFVNVICNIFTCM